jgi:glutathione S-transferase
VVVASKHSGHTLCCRHPLPGLAFGESDHRLRRLIQYFGDASDQSKRRGVLDTLVSRGMTIGANRWSFSMILIGQYDSPFVRRVGIALRLYELPFEHRPWSTFGDGDKIAPYNPLRRVPTLVLYSGEVVIESTAILDYLDEWVGPGKAMITARGPERRHALKICALAIGLGDKAVSLLYERVLRKKHQSKLWAGRCEAQISGVLDVLEKERAAIASPFWLGTRIGHADIAVACVLRFTSEAHPALFDAARYPALTAHAARCEALAEFVEIAQPLSPPSG